MESIASRLDALSAATQRVWRGWAGASSEPPQEQPAHGEKPAQLQAGAQTGAAAHAADQHRLPGPARPPATDLPGSPLVAPPATPSTRGSALRFKRGAIGRLCSGTAQLQFELQHADGAEGQRASPLAIAGALAAPPPPPRLTAASLDVAAHAPAASSGRAPRSWLARTGSDSEAEAAASAADTDSAETPAGALPAHAPRGAGKRSAQAGGRHGYSYALPRIATRRRPHASAPSDSLAAHAGDPAAASRADPALASAEPTLAASAGARCDKCDSSKHGTADCPHYPKERPDHADARARPSKAELDAASATVLLSGARVVPQPGDGNCLFHSLAHGLDDGSDALELRGEVMAFIGRNAATEICATPLRDWIRWDAGTSIAAYVRRMSTGGTWGGGIELAALSIMRGVNVHVFEATHEAGRFKRIGFFPCATAADAGSIHVLYRGGAHYDALEGGVVTSTPPREAAVTRAK